MDIVAEVMEKNCVRGEASALSSLCGYGNWVQKCRCVNSSSANKDTKVHYEVRKFCLQIGCSAPQFDVFDVFDVLYQLLHFPTADKCIGRLPFRNIALYITKIRTITNRRTITKVHQMASLCRGHLSLQQSPAYIWRVPPPDYHFHHLIPTHQPPNNV